MKRWLLLGTFLLLVILLVLKQLKFKGSSPAVETNCEAKLEASSNKIIERFDIIPKSVDFSSFPEAKIYYTKITEGVKKGVNFSGHYILIPIGCGTDCVLFSVVDARTSKVIAYNSGKANYHLVNKGSYFILEPVFEGQTREFYKIVEDENFLKMVCSEESKTDMYVFPEGTKP